MYSDMGLPLRGLKRVVLPVFSSNILSETVGPGYIFISYPVSSALMPNCYVISVFGLCFCWVSIINLKDNLLVSHRIWVTSWKYQVTEEWENKHLTWFLLCHWLEFIYNINLFNFQNKCFKNILTEISNQFRGDSGWWFSLKCWFKSQSQFSLEIWWNLIFVQPVKSYCCSHSHSNFPTD